MQARWLRLTVRDSRTPTTRTQKLSRRLLRNDRGPCRASRKAAVTSLFIRTPIRSQTNRKFYAPASLLPENVVYRGPILRSRRKSLKSHTQTGSETMTALCRCVADLVLWLDLSTLIHDRKASRPPVRHTVNGIGHP